MKKEISFSEKFAEVKRVNGIWNYNQGVGYIHKLFKAMEIPFTIKNNNSKSTRKGKNNG